MANLPADLLTDADPLEWPLHPTEERLIRYMRALGYGTIEQLKVEAGKPVLIERVIEKVKLS